MDNNNKRHKFTKLFSFTTASLMLMSSFTGFSEVASAIGVSVGTSGSISSDGATKGQAGGISYLDTMAFRVTMKEDKELVNYDDSGRSNAEVIADRFEYRYPDLGKDGIVFAPKDEYKNNSNYEFGFYSNASRKINKYPDVPDKLGRKQLVQYDEDKQTKPSNKIKEKLSEYALSSGKKKSYTELEKGKWKKIFSGKKYTRADSIKYWGYVLKTRSKGSKSYSITTNLNESISKHSELFAYSNKSEMKELYYDENKTKLEDVNRGWLASMIHLWRIAPSGTKEKYEKMIENAISGKKQGGKEKPISFVVDTMITVKWTAHDKRLVMPSADFLQYYAKSGSKYNLQKIKQSEVSNAKDTYTAFERLIQKDMKAFPKQERLSDRFNANNAFSWGSAAVANKKKWFNTTNRQAKWSNSTVEDATMDVIAVKERAYGMAVASFSPLRFHKPENAEIGYKSSVTPSIVRKVSTTTETLNYKNTVDIKPLVSTRDRDTFRKMLDENPTQNKTITVRVDLKRATEKTNTSLAIGSTNYKKTAKGYWGKGIKMNPSEFIKFVSGSYSPKIIDDVSKAKIAQGGRLDFKYTPKVSFSVYNGPVKANYVRDVAPVVASYERGKAGVPDPALTGTLTVTPPSQKLAHNQETPTNNHLLTIQSKASASAVSKWTKLFSAYPTRNKNLTIGVTTERLTNSPETAQATFDNGNAPSGNWTKGVTVSQSEFLSILKGTKKITYTDTAIKKEKLAKKETKKFNYKTKFYVKYTNNGKAKTAYSVQEKSATLQRADAPSTTGGGACSDEETQDSESDTGSSSCDTTVDEEDEEPPAQPDIPDCTDCDEVDTDTPVTEEETLPQKMMFTSASPTAYSEVKEGSRPYQENFDAMSGVPSNKRLYYSVGGTEYVVDFELEYVKNKDSVWRTYEVRYKGVPSEFKAGDDAGSKPVGGYSIDVHNGSSTFKEWTGSIPNKGVSKTVSGKGTVSATSTAIPDRTAYNVALKEAQAYQKVVMETEHQHTAVSDGKTRKYKGWDATVIPNPDDPKTITETKNFSHKEMKACPTKDAPSKMCEVTVDDPGTVTANKDGAGKFSIKVQFGAPRAVIDGPDSFNDMPDIVDTWKQRINYDYLKINRANVYKLTKGVLTNASEAMEVGGDLEELRAKINENDTSMIYNIAEESSIKAVGDTRIRESSRAGRIRYSLEKFQHDTVVWNKGYRQNKSDGQGCPSGGAYQPCGGGHTNFWSKVGMLYTNSTFSTVVDRHDNLVGTKTKYSDSTVDSADKATPEWETFDKLRHTKVVATIIPDTLIIRGSSGDLPAMYFDKDSTMVESQEQFPDLRISREEMWEGNPKNARTWLPNHINTGSYNGQFTKTSTKYEPYNLDSKTVVPYKGTIKTAFDDNGTGLDMERPLKAYNGKMGMFISKPIDITKPNEEYNLGESKAFYKELLNYESGNPYEDTPNMDLEGNAYQADDSDYFEDDGVGFDLDANYGDGNGGPNKVIIHTPVSTQNAVIIAQPKERDQRIDTPKGGASALIDEANELSVGADVGNNMFSYSPYVKETTKTTNTIYTTVNSILLTKPQDITLQFDYTGATQKYVVPHTGVYTITSYGAQGGGNTSNGSPGGKGGLMQGDFKLKKGQELIISVGGKGTDATQGIDGNQYLQNPGGWNGGGKGSGSAGSGGGGATDIAINGNRILVAGGGGGDGRNDITKSSGGQTSNLTTTKNGEDGIVGTTGRYPYDHSGGGGGYYGGAIINQEDAMVGYGGSSYVDSSMATNTINTVGSNTGNGRLQINSKDIKTETVTKEDLTPDILVTEDISEDGSEDSYKGWKWSDILGTTDWRAYFDEKKEVTTRDNTTIVDNVYRNGVLVKAYPVYDENSPLYQADMSGEQGEVKSITRRVKTVTTEEITSMTLTLNEAKAMADLDKFPDRMLDGSFNVLKADKGVKEPVPESPIKKPIPTTGGGVVRLGTFINLDHEFEVYFPNTGDFAQQPSLHGIADTTQIRGLGYYNNMDLTQYTRYKRVKFPFSVIYNNVTYSPDTWIELSVPKEYFKFYVPLTNVEMSGADVEFESLAINSQPYEDPSNDNLDFVTNKDRAMTLDSLHGAYKHSYVDVVGRIGNLFVTDTDDVAYREMFKDRACKVDCKPTDWSVPDLVQRVDETKQVGIYGDSLNIHGEPTTTTKEQNTWGTQVWLNGLNRRTLPIKALDNPVDELKETQMRLGYNLYNEVTTIGNYQNGALRMIPYYYKLDLKTGDVIPLDVYREKQGTQRLLNEYKGADDGELHPELYDLKVVLDWDKERNRRNYTLLESESTKKTSEEKGEVIEGYVSQVDGTVDGPGEKVMGVVDSKDMTIPKGEYSSLGNYQRIVGDKTARTFIGTDYTDGDYKNPDRDLTGQDVTAPDFNPKANTVSDFSYGAQRWHLKVGLSTGAEFVKHGDKPTLKNLKAIKEDDGVILMAVDIVAIGDTFTLKHNEMGSRVIPIKRDGVIKNYDLTNTDIPNIMAVYEMDYDVVEDLRIRNSH